MTADFTVRNYGIDSSGRAILLTVYMHDWFETICEELGWRPVIIQGAFMSRVPSGGAKDSSGFHDEAGCIDLRTRDLTLAQIDALVRTCRLNGAAAWRRDMTSRHGGMDPHCHVTLGSDSPLSQGAWVSWGSYKSGGDGLAGPGSDYEFRPDPLVLTPPEDTLNDDDKAWLDNLIDAKLAANNTTLAKAILAAAVNKAGDTVKKALRISAGLGD